MDSGLDTGPILLRREFRADRECESLTDLRNRMIAEGIELIARLLPGSIAAPSRQIRRLTAKETGNFS